VVLRLIHNFCIINTSHLSNSDQTFAGLLARVVGETCLHTHSSTQRTL
jgi:hypothetical protein